MTAFVCRLAAFLVLLAGVGTIAFASRFGTGGALVGVAAFVVTFGLVTALWALARVAQHVGRIERHLRRLEAGGSPTPPAAAPDEVEAFFQ